MFVEYVQIKSKGGDLQLLFHFPIPQELWAAELWRSACRRLSCTRRKGTSVTEKGSTEMLLSPSDGASELRTSERIQSESPGTTT